MDVTVEYVKMCEQAKEIQAMVHQREFTNKDYFARSVANGDVWMPRVDQLLELLDIDESIHKDDHVSKIKHILASLSKTINDNNSLGSFEQLSMMAVMKNNYGKVWNVISKEWDLEH